MKKFKNELGRISVLASQYMASKLWDEPSESIRAEIGVLAQSQPFSVRRQVAISLKADVHSTVAKNLNDRKERKWK